MAVEDVGDCNLRPPGQVRLGDQRTRTDQEVAETRARRDAGVAMLCRVVVQNFPGLPPFPGTEHPFPGNELGRMAPSVFYVYADGLRVGIGDAEHQVRPPHPVVLVIVARQ